MKPIKILFTGAGRRIELIQAFRQAALVQNKDLKIYGADITNTAPALAFCDATRLVCGMKEDGYIDNLLDICRDDEIDLLIPTIDTDLLVLSENKEKFEEAGIRVLIAAPEMIKVCRDKNNTSAFFEECGLKAPRPFNDWKEYDGGFPAFIKPKDGSSSIDAYKVNNIDELETYSKQVDDYVVQRYIDGREYTVDAFCDFDGNPLYIIPRERLAVRAGEVLKTKICMDETIISEMQQLISVFKPCGPITVQLIRDRITEENYYIEINPRFGGGAPLSMKAGARSAEALLRLICSEKVECGQIEDGAVYSRFDQSVCIEEGHTGIKGVIFDLDDTLYSEKDYVRSGYKAVSDYLGDETYEEELWGYFSDGRPAIDELLKRINREEEKDKILNVYREHFPNIALYDGVIDLIEDLKQRNIRVGIITDGRPNGQRNKIEALGLSEHIDDIIITDELGGVQFRKPCDIAFRIMQTKWRLNYSEIVYIGDNPQKDFQAPRQLGMRSLFLYNKTGLYKELFQKCDLEAIYDFNSVRRFCSGLLERE